MPTNYHIEQYELSDGHIASCFTADTKKGFTQFCEIQGIWAQVRVENRTQAPQKYDTVILKCLAKIHGPEHNISIIRN